MARALGLDVGDGGVLAVGEDGSSFGPSPASRSWKQGRSSSARTPSARAGSSRASSRVSSGRGSTTKPLGPPFPTGLRAVDLVYGHLESLWCEAKARTSEVVLAVPGVYDERQLGRLVGITQALGLPVSGAVDSALAASAGFTGERLLHVDLGQRRALVTQIRQGTALVRERVAVIDRWGMDELHEAQMRGAAQAFVTQARFDPLHDAVTEQALFDRLPGWTAALERAEGVAAALSVGGREVETMLTRAQVEGWTARFADELQQQVSVLQARRGAHGRAGLGSRGAGAGARARLAAVRGVEAAASRPGRSARSAAGPRGGPLGTWRAALRHAAAAAGGAGSREPRCGRPRAAGAAERTRAGGRRPHPRAPEHAAHAIGAEPLVVGTAPPRAPAA